MIKEPVFKNNLINTLNKRHAGWVDGDRESGHSKKVDVINKQLSIAIEIKDDTQYEHISDQIARVINIKLMNQRLGDHVNSANKKFKVYPDYKTIVLFRTKYIPSAVKDVIEGLRQYRNVDGVLSYTGRVGKYSEFGKNEVGGFLIINDEAYYFQNPFAKPKRRLEKRELESLVGWQIKKL